MKKLSKILGDKKYIIDDELISDIQAKDIHDKIMNYKTPWFTTEHTRKATVDGLSYLAYKKLGKPIIEGPQFVHRVVAEEGIVNNNFFSLAEIFTKKICQKYEIDSLNLLRLKLNYQSPIPDNKEGMYNTPHYDQTTPHLAMIYYVNDTDGDTYIFDDVALNIHTKVSPKMGRCLFLDGSMLHTGQHPIKSEYRVVANFNWED